MMNVPTNNVRELESVKLVQLMEYAERLETNPDASVRQAAERLKQDILKTIQDRLNA